MVLVDDGPLGLEKDSVRIVGRSYLQNLRVKKWLTGGLFLVDIYR